MADKFGWDNNFGNNPAPRVGPYKVEYRRDQNAWEAQYSNSLISTLDLARKFRGQGFEVRCLNSLGQNIV